METLSYCQLMEHCVALVAEVAALKRNLEGTAEFCYSELPETPTTDAFLAEVRAQGVEIFGDYLNGLGWDEKDIKQVRDFAAQLRQEAAQ